MAGKPVGTMFAEISLDSTKLEQGLKRTNEQLTTGAIKVEDAYKSLGIKSDAVYEMMRKNATAAVDFIKSKTISSTEEIVRAQKAAADRIKQINEQQFGHQATMAENVKKNWLVATVAITAAWMAVNKAMEWAELGAKAMQAETAFKNVADSVGANAERMIADLKRVTAGTVDDSDLMQKAFKAMSAGMKPDDVVKLAEVSRTAARRMGVDVGEAYASIIDAVETMRTKSLRAYGLLTKGQQEVIDKAKAVGVEIDLMRVITLNWQVQQERMGKEVTNAAENMQKYKVVIQETREAISKIMITTFGWIALQAKQRNEDKIAEYGQGGVVYSTNIKRAPTAAAATVDPQAQLKAEMDRLKAQTEAAAASKKAADDAAAAAKRAAEAYARLVERAEEFRAKASEDIKLQGLVDLQKDLQQNANEAENAKRQFDGLQGSERALTLASIEAVKQAKDRVAISKDEAKIMEEIKKRLDDETEATNKLLEARDKVDETYQSLLESVDPLTKAQNEYKRQLIDIEAWEKQNGTTAVLARQKLKEATDETLYSIQMATLALGDFSDGATMAFATLSHDALTQSQIMANVVEDTAKDMKQSMSDIFFDGMENGFRSLSDIFDSFCTSLKRSFANALAEMVSQTAIFKSALASMTSISGGLLSGITEGNIGSGFSMSNITSGISSAWSAITNPTSLLDKVSGLWSGITGSASNAIVVFDELGNVVNTAVSTFDTLSGLMTSFINPWTLALAGVGALVSALGLGKTEIIHQQYGYEADPATVQHMMDAIRDDVYGVNAASWSSYMEKSKSYTGHVTRRTYKTETALDDETWTIFDDIYKSISANLVKMGNFLKDDIDKVFNYDFGAQNINLTGITDAAEIKTKIEEWAKTLSDTAVEALFGDFFKQFQTGTEGLADAAVRVITETTYMMATLDNLNVAFDLTGKESIVASENMIALAGGIDILRENMAAYYENFFTDSEKHQDITESLATAMDALSMAIPETREGFRALVESTDTTTDAFVALMAAQGLANTYYAYIENERKAYISLMTTLQDMKITVMELEGNEDALLMRRAYQLEQMDPLLRATQMHIWELGAEAEAEAKAAEIAKAKGSMEIDLLTAQGKTAEATAIQRQAELAVMDESLRPLQLLIYAQEDLNTINARAAEIAMTRRSLEIQIMELSGDATGALAAKRADELAALDESLRPLQQRIYDLQDEATAIDDTAKAHDVLMSTLKDNLSTAESAMKDAFSTEKQRITDDYAAKIDRLNEKMQKAKDTVGTLTDAFNSLQSARKSMELQVAGTQQANYFATLKDLPSLVNQVGKGNYSGLTDDVLSTLTDSGNAKYYGSAVDYKRDYYKIYNALSTMEQITGARKTAAEESVELLQKQIEDLEAFRDKELDALDAQLNAILGVQANILTLAQAISQYQDAYAALTNAEGSGATSTPTESRAYTGPSLVNSGFANTKGPSRSSNDDVVVELREVKALLKEQGKDIQRHRKIADSWEGNGMPDSRGY